MYLQKEDNKLLMNSDYNKIIMEYQLIINLLDNMRNQLSKFRTKNRIEVNDQSRAVCNNNSDIRSKTTMLNSLVYMIIVIHVKGRIAITGEGDYAAARQADERNKGVIFKNCAPSINCESEINNIKICILKIVI